MSTPYEPKIIANAMDLPAVMPEAAGAVDCHVIPFEVKTFPDVLGATNKGADVPLPRTTLLAVKVVAPVPPLATGKVPVTPVVKGNPVADVSTKDVGVPKLGVVSIGLVKVLFVRVSVPVKVAKPEAVNAA
tara:strand:- start:181 stop:573 length:393 start_codon:yes stop_codon:yes gene_type:complete